MSSYLWLAAALALLASNGVTAWKAYGYGKDAGVAQVQEAERRAADEQAARAIDASAVDAARQAELDAQAAAAQQGVTAYALTDAGRATCLDAAGLRLFNEAGGYPDPTAVRSAPARSGPGASAGAARADARRPAELAPTR